MKKVQTTETGEVFLHPKYCRWYEQAEQIDELLITKKMRIRAIVLDHIREKDFIQEMKQREFF